MRADVLTGYRGLSCKRPLRPGRHDSSRHLPSFAALGRGSTTAVVVLCRPFAALGRGSTTAVVVICRPFAALDRGSTTAVVVICRPFAALDWGSTTATVVICRPFAALGRGSTTAVVVICRPFAALGRGSTTATGVIICQQNACRAIVPFRRACSTFQSHGWRGFQPFREGLFYLFSGFILHLTLKCSISPRLFYLSKPRLARLSAFSRGLFYLSTQPPQKIGYPLGRMNIGISIVSYGTCGPANRFCPKPCRAAVICRASPECRTEGLGFSPTGERIGGENACWETITGAEISACG